MDQTTYAQRCDDLRAYVETLDPNEALSEAVHVGREISSSIVLGALGLAPARAALTTTTLLSVALSLLVHRYVEAVGTEPTPLDPERLHICTLIERMVEAAGT